jgi:succinyl-CoA synthetase alpha subunit
MGHAGAIISGKGESAAEKVELLQEAGVHIVPNPSELGTTMKAVLEKNS